MHAREHFLQFYEDDAVLLEALKGSVAAGLSQGAAAVVVATRPHLDAVERALGAAGIAWRAAAQRGQYVAVDAATLLSKLMRDGSPPGTTLRSSAPIP